MVAGRGALWGQFRGIVIVVAVLVLLYGGVAVCSLMMIRQAQQRDDGLAD